MTSTPEGSDLPKLKLGFDATPLLGRHTGIAVFARCAIEALAARSDLAVKAFVVSWRTRGAVAPYLPRSVTLVDRPMPALPTRSAWRRVSGPPIEWWTGPLDVVHGTNYTVPPARHAARVVTVHDLAIVRYPQLCQEETISYASDLRRAIAGGAFVHTPSEYVAQEVVETLGAHPDRVRAVPHGVPPLVTPAGMPADDPPVDLRAGPFIVAVGTVEPRKDYPTLVAAFDALAATRPELRLVIAGTDGWGAEALDAAVSAAHSRDRIVRLGWVDNCKRDALLRAATVLAYPSLYEGFGFPPLEAMAAGVPVVATDAGALPEVLADGADLVPTRDPDALAAALAAVLDDGDTRARLIARGRARARHFTWAACAEGLNQLYRTARQ